MKSASRALSFIRTFQYPDDFIEANSKNDCPEDYTNYFRMSDENVKYLLAKVSPYILKQDTVMRIALTPEERTAVFSLQDVRLKISSSTQLYHLKLWAESFQRLAELYSL
mgnify:CR=1 FL=1